MLSLPLDQARGLEFQFPIVKLAMFLHSRFIMPFSTVRKLCYNRNTCLTGSFKGPKPQSAMCRILSLFQLPWWLQMESMFWLPPQHVFPFDAVDPVNNPPSLASQACEGIEGRTESMPNLFPIFAKVIFPPRSDWW